MILAKRGGGELNPDPEFVVNVLVKDYYREILMFSVPEITVLFYRYFQ